MFAMPFICFWKASGLERLVSDAIASNKTLRFIENRVTKAGVGLTVLLYTVAGAAVA